MKTIFVANIKYVDSNNFEEIRGYDDLNIQPNCFVFQWLDTQQLLIIPMHRVDYITTSEEESQ